MYIMLCYDGVRVVTGCGDYEAPPGAVATRTRDRVSVRCSSGAQWELRCELGRWVGRNYNCSDVEWTQAWTIGRLLNSPGNFSRGVNLYRLPDLREVVYDLWNGATFNDLEYGNR